MQSRRIPLLLSLYIVVVPTVHCHSNCQQLRVEKICNLPKDFLHMVDADFYQKFVMASGIPIMASNNTPDLSLVEAARVVKGIMDRLKPEIVDALLRRQQRIIMYGQTENSCSLPEQAGSACRPSLGLGLSYSNIISIPYLREKCEDHGHGPYVFLIHEFGHAVNSVFHEIDKRLQTTLDDAYQNARLKKIWPLNSYNMLNVAEYFPLCWTPLWLKINHKCQEDASYCSRDKCAQRDPKLYALVLSLLENPIGDFLNLECSQQCDFKSVKKYSIHEQCHNESTFTTLKLQNLATGQYLDSNVNGQSYTLPENTGYYQKWIITMPRTNGTSLQILNIATGLALEADGHGKVYTSVWNKESRNQEWTFIDDSVIKNVGTGGVLESNDKGAVYAAPTESGNYNQWRVI